MVREALIVIPDGWSRPGTPGRRPGFVERRLIGPNESVHQNLVLVETAAGAEVEQHPVRNSESLIILEGEYEPSVPGHPRLPRLGPGSFVYFPPGMVHGLRCITGPGRYLVVFAPSAAKQVPDGAEGI